MRGASPPIVLVLVLVIVLIPSVSSRQRLEIEDDNEHEHEHDGRSYGGHAIGEERAESPGSGGASPYLTRSPSIAYRSP